MYSDVNGFCHWWDRYAQHASNTLPYKDFQAQHLVPLIRPSVITMPLVP